MHRFEFQRRGLGVEEICPSPSHRTLGLDIGVCHETRMRNPGKFQFHMMWVFRDSALGLRFWSGCVCLPCILGSVLRCIIPLGDLETPGARLTAQQVPSVAIFLDLECWSYESYTAGSWSISETEVTEYCPIVKNC